MGKFELPALRAKKKPAGSFVAWRIPDSLFKGFRRAQERSGLGRTALLELMVQHCLREAGLIEELDIKVISGSEAEIRDQG